MTKHIFASAIFAVVCGLGFAGEPEALKVEPPRPFPELRDVLWFEDFENPGTLFEKGKIVTENSQMPGGHTYELGEADWGRNEKFVWANVPLTRSGAKIPGGMNPNQVMVQFMIWSDDTGEITIKCKHKDGDYEEKARPNKEKMWVPITIKFADMRNKNSMPKAEHVTDWLEILFRPRDKKYPKVYIDDFIITGNAVRPMDVMPRVMLARKAVVELTRTVAKDSFSYSPHTQDLLKSALKSAGVRRKPKHVLVIGSTPGDSDDLVKALSTAAPKIKATGYTFNAATAPDGTAGGLEDMRMLLPYNVQKENPESMLMVLSYADALRPGRPSESVRVVLERALGAGCVPIVVLAPAAPSLGKDEKTKVDAFNTGIVNVCIQLGVMYIDPNAANKSAPEAYDKNELSALGRDGMATVAAQAVRHLELNLFNKK
ncbi:MAG TPA: hypothetical protein VEK08_15615 [Planctomycetota bacterium]|nr:hypothetical protein [Planctomycetota bacterium]